MLELRLSSASKPGSLLPPKPPLALQSLFGALLNLSTRTCVPRCACRGAERDAPGGRAGRPAARQAGHAGGARARGHRRGLGAHGAVPGGHLRRRRVRARVGAAAPRAARGARARAPRSRLPGRGGARRDGAAHAAAGGAAARAGHGARHGARGGRRDRRARGGGRRPRVVAAQAAWARLARQRILRYRCNAPRSRPSCSCPRCVRVGRRTVSRTSVN